MMEKYYFIVSGRSFSDPTLKLTYTQYLKYAETHTNAVFKVLKADYNALEKSLRGVVLKNKVEFIFNRLHTAGKTSRA